MNHLCLSASLAISWDIYAKRALFLCRIQMQLGTLPIGWPDLAALCTRFCTRLACASIYTNTHAHTLVLVHTKDWLTQPVDSGTCTCTSVRTHACLSSSAAAEHTWVPRCPSCVHNHRAWACFLRPAPHMCLQESAVAGGQDSFLKFPCILQPWPGWGAEAWAGASPPVQPASASLSPGPPFP